MADTTTTTEPSGAIDRHGVHEPGAVLALDGGPAPIAEAILHLHQPNARWWNGLGCPTGWMRCSAGCHRVKGDPWPCPTVRALYDACGLPHPDPIPTPRDHADFVPLGECQAQVELGKPCRWDLDHGQREAPR